MAEARLSSSRDGVQEMEAQGKQAGEAQVAQENMSARIAAAGEFAMSDSKKQPMLQGKLIHSALGSQPWALARPYLYVCSADSPNTPSWLPGGLNVSSTPDAASDTASGRLPSRGHTPSSSTCCTRALMGIKRACAHSKDCRGWRECEGHNHT